MALTISTPFKTNTLASVSGTTFTSNGTPFVAGDVGRFIVFTNGNAIGQIRRIVSLQSTTEVTVDLAWDVSNVDGFTDSLPTSGDTWVMSLTLDDIDDNVHIIKVTANSYRAVPSAGLVTIGAGVFVADTSLSFEFDSNFISLNAASFWQFGYLAPGGYGLYGCLLTDLATISSSGGWSGSTSGNTGDLHLYGCNVNSSLTGSPFWRLFRGDGHIVRFIDCDFNGNFAGRVRGSRSVLLRCTYRGNTSASSIAGIGAVAAFGLISECRVQASNQAIYCAYSLGVGTVTSPKFDAISGRIFAGAIVTADGTYVIEDYVESEITSAPNVVNSVATRAGAILSFRQWVDTALVDVNLNPITDTAKRVIKNGASTIVDSTSTTSGAFSRYTAELRRFSMVSGNQSWSDGTAFGPYQQAIASYGLVTQVLSLPLARSSNLTLTMLPDTDITVTNKATVDAYTEIENSQKFYDRAKAFLFDNYQGEANTIVTRTGTLIDAGAYNVTIDATAASAFAVAGNTITIKASTYTGDMITTGTITLANGAVFVGTRTDTNGTISPPKLASVTNIVDGSRIQVYNDTTDTEIANLIVSGTSWTLNYIEGVEFTAGDVVRVRLAEKTGATAYIGLEVQTLATSNGWSIVADQLVDTVYGDIGIDGSTITEFATDFPNVQIDIDDPDGSTTLTRLYAWFVHIRQTEDGIRNWLGGIVAEDAANYKIVTSKADIKLDNASSDGVIFLGDIRLYRDDGQAPVVSNTTGGGSITLYAGKVLLQDLSEIKKNTDLIPAVL